VMRREADGRKDAAGAGRREAAKLGG
jgi:hypothetical protein